jgi:rhomboid protease GluP
MTLDLILIQIVAISCIAILIRSRKNQGWSIVAAGILGLLTFGVVTKAPWTAGVCGGLWLVGILLPIQGMAQIARLRSQEKYTQARWISQLVRILHPGDGWWHYPQVLQALDLANRGDLDQALAILHPLQSIDTYDGRLAIATAYGLQAKWSEYLDLAQTQLTPAMRLEETSSAGTVLRSLGETRQINELLEAVKEVHIRARKTGNTPLLLLAKLYAFAFSGQVEDVRTLLRTYLTAYSPSLQRFWIATAEWYAGNFDVALPEFQDLAMHSHSSELRNSLKARSHQAPLRTFELLTIESRNILMRLQDTQQQDTQYNPRTTVTRKQAPLTYWIIAINVLIYLAPFFTLLLLFKLDVIFPAPIERVLDSIATIYDWGALVPNQLFAGAWWQPLTAMFMHDPSGIAHIVLNMFGLVIVGAFVESRLGTIKFAIAYFISGLGSMGILAVLARVTGAGTMSAIGASGAIMGMVGVMGAMYWTGWRRGEQGAKQWLRSIVVIVSLQTVFDLLNPNVSMTGHMAGLILGAIVGLALVPAKNKSFTAKNIP